MDQFERDPFIVSIRKMIEARFDFWTIRTGSKCTRNMFGVLSLSSFISLSIIRKDSFRELLAARLIVQHPYLITSIFSVTSAQSEENFCHMFLYFKHAHRSCLNTSRICFPDRIWILWNETAELNCLTKSRQINVAWTWTITDLTINCPKDAPFYTEKNVTYGTSSNLS